MRSVETPAAVRPAAAALALLAASLAGCAMLAPAAPEAPAAAPQARQEPRPVAVASAASAAPAAASAAPSRPTPAEKVVATAPPVDPAAQRAFDDAVRALRAGRVDEAERGFEALARVHPELGGVHANLALLHRRAGRDAEAVAALEQAVKLSPRQPLYFNQLGIAYRQLGQFAKAREAYESAIALDAGYAAPQLNLAILLDLYLGERARAAEWYQRSAVLLPGDAVQINKWLADLKNRRPEASLASVGHVAARKEKD